MPNSGCSFSRALLLGAACALICLPNRSTAQPSASPFDGQSLDGWTTLDGGRVTRGWEVVDGTIHLQPSDDRVGHIVTAQDVGNFVLSFEFKIAPGGNSGLKYRVRDFNGSILGCEYQIYDDAHPDHPVEPKNSTGSLYDVYEPAADKPLNPADEFNTAKIVVVDDVIEHWLNGRLIVRAVVGSQEWRSRIAESKFHDDPGFGENRFGKIMLTDHGSEVWYRNFDFTALPTEPASRAHRVAASHGPAPGGCSPASCFGCEVCHCTSTARHAGQRWSGQGRFRRARLGR